MNTERQWRAWLLNRAKALGLSASDAEDLIQDVLLAFWRKHSRTLPWEYFDRRTAKLHCLRLLKDKYSVWKRRNSSQYEILQSECEGEWTYALIQTESEVLEQVHCTELLTRLRLKLSSRQQQILDLLEQGWTEQEIGQMLGISTGAVKSQINRIRRKAKALMDGL